MHDYDVKVYRCLVHDYDVKVYRCLVHDYDVKVYRCLVHDYDVGGWPPFLSRPYPVFPNGTKIAGQKRTKKDKKGQKY